MTTRELCDYYKERTGKTITSNNLKQNYLNEFINNGLIDEEDSVLDSRQKVYHPIIDIPDNEDFFHEHDQKIPFLSISDRMDNILQHPRLLVPKRFKYIPENWLELEILDLLKYTSIIDRFELYNEKNERKCICKFISEYQKIQMINGYFTNAVFYNNHNKIFGRLEDLNQNSDEICKIISIGNKMDKKDTLIGNMDTVLRAQRNNIAYAQVIKNNQLAKGSIHSYGETITKSDTISLLKSVEDFFADDPSLPWRPLPEHDLQESPCYPVINKRGNLYRCKIHHYMESPYLDVIEHHCKYKEPEYHKAEIIRLVLS